MSNKFYGGLAGKGGGKVKASDCGEDRGKSMPSAMPMRTASWPGLPGKTGPDRAGGTPKAGKRAPFHVKAEGL